MKFDYTRIYRVWHDDSAEHRAEMIRYTSRFLLPHLPQSRDVRILDVGCGMGFTLLTLKELGYTNIAGVDRDEGQVEAARKFGLDVAQTDDTIAFLRERAGQYDLILCIDVIEHIPVDVQLDFVRAVSEALHPDGQLIATVPNAYSAFASIWRYNCWTHTSSFTEHSLDLLIYNGGFNDIRVLPCEIRERPKNPWLPVKGTRNYWLWRFMRLWRRLQITSEFGGAVGWKVPLSLNFLLVAKKK